MRTTITHVKHPTKAGFKCGTRNRWGYTAPEGREPTCKLCSGTRRAPRNPAVSPVGHIKPGDVFYDSWGYNMTIVDFYRVVRLTPKGATVVGLKSIETATGYLSGTAVPHHESNGEIGTLKFKMYGPDSMYLSGTIKEASGTNHRRKVTLSKWDGKPKYFNHCD